MVKKNIAFVIGIMGNGGAERVVSVLSNKFVEKGLNVSIIAIYGDRVDYELNENIDYYPIICKTKIKVFRPIERIIKISRYLKKSNCDIVISFLADVDWQPFFGQIYTEHKTSFITPGLSPFSLGL